MSLPTARLLHDLSRLVVVFGAAEGSTPEERRALVRSTVRGARQTGIVVDVRPDGLHVGGRLVPAEDDLRALLTVLAARGVGRLVVRQHAPAREIAQLAGVLARAGASGDMIEELAAMRLWHVQLDPAPEAIPGATDPLPDDAVAVLQTLRTAGSPADVDAAFAALGDWLARTRQATGGGLARGSLLGEDATTMLRVLTEAASDVLAHDPGRDDGRMARFADLIVGLDLRDLVDAIVGGTAPGATTVLQCIAPAAVPLLMERLATSATMAERQRCCDALFELGAGIDSLIDALRDPRWYVVRNAALVLGELRAEAAVRPLARCLHAAEARVRDAAARALSQIDTAAAMQALLPGLRDRSVEVRRLAARAAARAARRHAMIAASTCIAALEAEEDAEVTHELFGALGGLGSTDALQYLGRVVTGRTHSAYDPMLRIAAMEAIAASRSAAAGPMAGALGSDPDATVRRIAQRVLSRHGRRDGALAGR